MEINKTSAGGVPHSYTVKVVKKPLPTTTKMVDEALIALHSKSGVTLKQLTSYIVGKYVINLNSQRKALIRKRLYELRETGDISNLTGTGLTGHFTLADKKKFTSKCEYSSRKLTSKKRNFKAATHVKVRSQRKTSTRIEPQLSPESRSTFQLSPLSTPPARQMSSMFDIDTPPTLGVSDIFPLEPDLNSGNVISMHDTPIRSSPKKKRLTRLF